jgi:hypothetical protein
MSGSYTIFYSDAAKFNFPVTVSDDTTLNGVGTGNLTLVGRNYPAYGQATAENFIHLLENAASPVPPINPIEGQLWFDTSDPTNKKLRINDGAATNASWKPVNGIFQQVAEPTNAALGDIWVNTDLGQLKIYNGASFEDPNNYNVDTGTGSKPMAYPDIFATDHQVVEIKSNDKIVAVISSDEFTWQGAEAGFNVIRPGINVSTLYKNYGVSEKAEALIINSVAVPGNEFLRNNLNQTFTGQLWIAQNSNALTLGESKTFIIERSTDATVARLKNMTNNGTFEFVTKNSIGVDIQSLIIDGATQGVVIPTKTAASSTLTGALVVTGGVGVGADLYIGNNLHITNKIVIDGDVNGGIGTNGQVLASDGSGNVRWSSFNSNGFTGGIVTGILGTSDFTQSTNTNTGALIVRGGAGIGRNVNIGGDLSVAGNLTVTGIVSSSTTITTSSFQTTQIIVTTNTASSTSTTTGALVVAGGAGFAKDVWIGGNLDVAGTIYMNGVGLNTISGSTGTFDFLVVEGTGTGLAVTNNVTIGGNATVGGNTRVTGITTATKVQSTLLAVSGASTLTTLTVTGVSTLTSVAITATTVSASTITGALTVAGGVGIRGNLYVGGEIVAEKLTIQLTTVTTVNVITDDIVTVLNTSNAISVSSGAIQTLGGVGVTKDIYVGGNATVDGFINGTLLGLATSATNIAGGNVGYIPMQSAAGVTKWIVAASGGQFLKSNGTTATFVSTTTMYVDSAVRAEYFRTARTITFTGDVTGSFSLDGTQNTGTALTIQPNSIDLGTDTVGDYISTGSTTGYGLSGGAVGEGTTFTVNSNATSTNSASTIMFRDANGNFAANNSTGAIVTATTYFSGSASGLTAIPGGQITAGSVPNTALTSSTIGFTAGGAIGISRTTAALGDTVTITNLGVYSLTGTGAIAVSASTGTITLTNLGVTSLAGSAYLGVSASTGTVTITNQGVTNITTGSGIVVTAAIGTVNIASIDTLDLVTGRGASTTVASTFNGGLTVGNASTLLTNGVFTATGTLNYLGQQGSSIAQTLIWGTTAGATGGLGALAVKEGGLYVSGATELNSAVRIATGGLTVAGGQVSIRGGLPATNTFTGDLVTVGGIGIGGGVVAGAGFYSTGTFAGSFSDGIVADYVLGNGRISVGGADAITFYNGGVANTPLMTIAATGTVSITTASQATDIYSGALRVAGGVGIVKDVWVGGAIYVVGQQVITTATVNSYANQTALTAGTDTAISTSTGNITVWNTSTLQSVTGRGATTPSAITITNSTSSTSTTSGALIVAGGVGIGGNMWVGGNLGVTGTVTANGATVLTTSTLLSTNFKPITGAYLTTATQVFAWGDVFVPNVASVNVTGMYNTSTGAISPTVPGFYKINMSAWVSAASTGWYAQVQKNGITLPSTNVVLIGSTVTGSQGTIYTGSGVLYFNGTTDTAYVSVFAGTISSGDTVTFKGSDFFNTQLTSLTVEWVSP